MSPASWLGIDVGGTFIKWELATDTGDTLDFGQTTTPRGGQLAVTEALAEIVNARRTSPNPPAGVGIAVPGHLSPTRDSITLLPNVAGDWPGYPVVAALHERTGLVPILLNDARAFAGAEHAVGAARASSDVVFVTVGTGVGGAVAVDGAVLRSRRDALGEIGHTTVVVDGEKCSCGHRGCVEAYAGGAAILRRAARHGLVLTPGPHALRDLLAMADAPVVARILVEAYDALAVGVSNACAFVGARLVVLGGGVVEELPGFLDHTRVRLGDRRNLLGDVEVRQGTLGVRAGAVGAAFAARQEFRGHGITVGSSA